jgi:hypothetical protein
MAADALKRPTLRLLSCNGELLISIDSRSWHVLDEPNLFPEGTQLRRAFGVTWVAGLYREPPHGILNHLPAQNFRKSCENVWHALLRDRDLLSFSYQYELESHKGVRHGGARSGGFTVRGLHPFITTRPKGYCTLKLAPILPSGKLGQAEEIIDLRKTRRIETDNAGFLKIHRRSMRVDWFDEMPRILQFAADPKADFIEVRLFDL